MVELESYKVYGRCNVGHNSEYSSVRFHLVMLTGHYKAKF